MHATPLSQSLHTFSDADLEACYDDVLSHVLTEQECDVLTDELAACKTSRRACMELQLTRILDQLSGQSAVDAASPDCEDDSDVELSSGDDIADLADAESDSALQMQRR